MAQLASSFERGALAVGGLGVAVVTVEFSQAAVDVGLVDRADALRRQCDLVQVVERRVEHLLRRREIAPVGEFTGVEPALEHVDQALALLQECVELLGGLRVGKGIEFGAQRGDLLRIDLLDPRHLELELGERSGRRHRERPRHGGNDGQRDEDSDEDPGWIDHLEHEPHGRCEHDDSDPGGRIADDRSPPALHLASIRFENTTTSSR